MKNTILKIKSKPWLSESYKPKGNHIWQIPTMITKEEKLMLSWLAEFFVKGDGHIADLGSFLGGSTAFLAHGLSQNKFVNNVKIHCYDIFNIPTNDLHTIEHFFPKEKLKFPHDGDIYPIFKNNVEAFSDYLVINRNRIENVNPDMDKIELLFIDIMKSPASYNHTLINFIPKLIPGKSIMILQDYLYKNSGPWHTIMMELLDDYFEKITDTNINSVVYFNHKKVPDDVLTTCLWENISEERKMSLLHKAKEKWLLVPHIEMIENQISNFKKSLHLLKYDLN